MGSVGIMEEGRKGSGVGGRGVEKNTQLSKNNQKREKKKKIGAKNL